MRSRNLIPSHRLEAARRRRRLKAWVGAVSVYAAVLVTVYVACVCAWGVDAGSLERRRQAAAERVEQVSRQIQETQAHLAEAQRTLDANRTIGGHPDWSLLLMLLSANMNDGVVLRQCRLTPPGAEDDTPGEAPATDGVGWRLEMAGYGRQVTAVSQFALAMEKTGLFDEVRLLKTVRQPFLAGQATHFQIRCDLGTRAKESP
ncbi:MAG: hypothetical protein R6X20_05845 [Phycisphaerae bacterium]